jgi:hypothetical protein
MKIRPLLTPASAVKMPAYDAQQEIGLSLDNEKGGEEWQVT